MNLRGIIILIGLSCFGQTQLLVTPEEGLLEMDSTIIYMINVSDVNSLYAAAFDVTYNPDQLQLANITEAVFLNADQTIATSFLISYQPGRAIVAISRMGQDSLGASTSEPAPLISIEFTALSPGTSTIGLENTGLLDIGLNQVSHTVSNSECVSGYAPVITEFPDTSLSVGDTLFLNLNDLVSDMDTPDSELVWQFVGAEQFDYFYYDDNSQIIGLSSLIESLASPLGLFVEDSQGFSDSLEVMIIFESNPNATRAYDMTLPNHFYVQTYPNPVNSRLQVATNTTIHTISMYNIRGQRVANYYLACSQSNYAINISDFASGNYLLLVSDQNNQTELKKITLIK